MFVRAYLRASTSEQDATRARAQLDAFAHERGLAIAAAYVENESGATLARPELFRLLKDCRPGDVLLIEQVLEQVVGGPDVEIVLGCQLLDGGRSRQPQQVVREAPDGEAEFERPSGAITLPERHLARLAGGR